MLRIPDAKRQGADVKIQKFLPARYADADIEQTLACAHADHLCSFAPLRKCRQHLRAQKFRRLSLHCCRVSLDRALSHKSGCNQDKKDKYAHQKGASTLNV